MRPLEVCSAFTGERHDSIPPRRPEIQDLRLPGASLIVRSVGHSSSSHSTFPKRSRSRMKAAAEEYRAPGFKTKALDRMRRRPAGHGGGASGGATPDQMAASSRSLVSASCGRKPAICADQREPASRTRNGTRGNEKTLVKKNNPAEADWAFHLSVTNFSIPNPQNSPSK